MAARNCQVSFGEWSGCSPVESRTEVTQFWTKVRLVGIEKKDIIQETPSSSHAPVPFKKREDRSQRRSRDQQDGHSQHRPGNWPSSS